MRRAGDILAGVRGAVSLTAFAIAACWRGPTPLAPPSDPDPEHEPVAADPDEVARKARCRNPPGEKLVSFNSVELRRLYWIDMYDDGAGWQPIDHLPAPYHHATRLELTNAADFAHRFRRGTRRARFLLEIRGREIRPASAGRPWLTTYRAYILEACVLRSRL